MTMREKYIPPVLGKYAVIKYSYYSLSFLTVCDYIYRNNYY